VRLAALLFAPLVAPLLAHGALEPGDHTFTLKHGGRERSYIVHVPPNAAQPAAVVISLHGGGGNAAAHQAYVRTDALADREGFVVVYPNGTGPTAAAKLLTWNAGTCCGYAQAHDVDDVGFVAALLDDLAARTPIDAKRVFATGMSNGAMMSYRLGAERPDRIAAIAPVAGAMVFAGAIRQPVPVLHIHSVDDPRALYAGGWGPPFPMTQQRVLHPAVEATLARWAKANRCQGEPRAAEPIHGTGAAASHTATPVAWAGCAAPLRHWKLTGAGHVWPGGQPKTLTRILGPGTDVIDANEEIWRFFSLAARR